MVQSYKETLTALRDNIADIQTAINNLDLDGSEPMDTWATQLATISTLISELRDQISTDDADFSDIYDAIVVKGQSPDEDDRDTYAPAILAINGGSANLDTLSVTPSTSSQTLTPTSPVDGWDEVLVAAVTAAIDANIVSGNIKNGVTILGVLGTYAGGSPNLQNKTVTPTTSQQSVQADSGYDGLDTVTVDAVTSSIDNNIQAGNIKNGVVILGVTGSYAGGGGNYQQKTVTPSNAQQVVQPDQGYDALSQVTVNTDQNLVANNIKQGVTIFGVVGSYSGGGGSITVNDLAFLLYRRNASGLWSIVSDNAANVTNFYHMCEQCTFDAGTYSLDLSNSQNRDDLFKDIRLSGVSNLTIILGTNFDSIQQLFNGANDASSSNYMNLAFSNKSNSNAITNIRAAFKNMTFGTLDISVITNTLSNIQAAFYGCNVLTDLVGYENLDISNLTEIREVFREFNINQSNSAFDTIDLSNWDFSNIQHMNQLFDNSRIKHVIFDSNTVFDNVSMASAFSYCQSLLDVTDLNIQETSYGTRDNKMFGDMFRNCTNLVSVTSTLKWVIRSGMEASFLYCSSLEDVPEIDFYIYDQGYKDSAIDMFNGCSSLEEVTINVYYTYANNHEFYCESMFRDCTALKYIKGDLNLNQVNNLNSIFYNCTSLISIDTTGGIAENINSDQTLDLSASAVFDIDDYLDNLATKITSYHRYIKLHSTVYNNLSAATLAKAAAKGYDLTT